MDDASTTAPLSRVAALRSPRVWLVLYAVTLAAIAFWPVPVDSGAGPLLRALARAVPWLTYDVIETGANVLLFVPFGVLLALVLARRRVLVLPIALLATILIEAVQALLLENRTPSLRDVIANVVGAAIGLLIVSLITRTRAPHS